MLTNLTALAGIVSLIITVALAIGGIFAFRGAANRSVTDLQKSTIEALQIQNETQEKQIVACEKKIARLERILETIQKTFEKRGLRIEINGETITLIEGPKASIVQIRMKPDIAEQNEEDS